MDTLRAFITANPIIAASLASLWGAVLIDLMAFKNSKDPGGFFETFSWRVAAWRYGQSLVGGFVGNAALAGAASITVGLAIWLW